MIKEFVNLYIIRNYVIYFLELPNLFFLLTVYCVGSSLFCSFSVVDKLLMNWFFTDRELKRVLAHLFSVLYEC